MNGCWRGLEQIVWTDRKSVSAGSHNTRGIDRVTSILVNLSATSNQTSIVSLRTCARHGSLFLSQGGTLYPRLGVHHSSCGCSYLVQICLLFVIRLCIISKCILLSKAIKVRVGLKINWLGIIVFNWVNLKASSVWANHLLDCLVTNFLMITALVQNTSRGLFH